VSLAYENRRGRQARDRGSGGVVNLSLHPATIVVSACAIAKARTVRAGRLAT
jgi:hypothetical protein